MRRNIFSSKASFKVGLLSLSTLFVFAFPSLQIFTPQNTESVMTEYGENFPWTVESGESIYTIAEKWYGDSSFASTIWNDNSWITNPNAIEVGWVLEIRYDRPILPEPLKPDLAEKQNLFNTGSYQITNSVSDIPAQPVVAVKTVSESNYSKGPLNESQLEFLGTCESGMTATRNSGNGYYGAFQFSVGTWNSMGTGYARADLAPLEVQKEAVQRLLSRSSIYTQFPGCARRMQGMGMI